MLNSVKSCPAQSCDFSFVGRKMDLIIAGKIDTFDDSNVNR
jgi:hypothetical protein